MEGNKITPPAHRRTISTCSCTFSFIISSLNRGSQVQWASGGCVGAVTSLAVCALPLSPILISGSRHAAGSRLRVQQIISAKTFTRISRLTSHPVPLSDITLADPTFKKGISALCKGDNVSDKCCDIKCTTRICKL